MEKLTSTEWSAIIIGAITSLFLVVTFKMNTLLAIVVAYAAIAIVHIGLEYIKNKLKKKI